MTLNLFSPNLSKEIISSSILPFLILTILLTWYLLLISKLSFFIVILHLINKNIVHRIIIKIGKKTIDFFLIL